MNCPLCGPVCTCAAPAASASTDTAPAFEQAQADDPARLDASHRPEIGNVYPEEQERWRNEVASRLNNYKARRRRTKGDDSMRFDFEAEPSGSSAAQLASAVAEQKSSREVVDTNYYRRANAEAMSMGAVAVAPAAEDYPDYDPDFDFVLEKAEAQQQANDAAEQQQFESSEAQADEGRVYVEEYMPAPPPAPVAEPAPLPVNNIIVFPRPTMEPPLMPLPRRDELADPVFDKPRILDVPEDNAPTIEGPLFADIRLDTEQEETVAQHPPASAFEIPLQVAPMAQRAFASACDWGVIATACGLFYLLSWKSLGELPSTKPGMAALATVPFVLFAIYQFLFHLYTGLTPGMQFAHLRLCDFDRDLPDWDRRKRRALFATFSCLSVGLGYLWALMDEDTLCWHDRASKTYLTQE